MIEGLIALLATFLAGTLLALAYLWHLRWSVGTLTRSARPGTRLATGLAIRLLTICVLFYAIGHVYGAVGIAAAIAGFLVVRTIVVKLAQAAISRAGDDA